MNNFDISQYLVEPEFAAWLKEQGFDGECTHWFWEKENIKRQANKSADFDKNWNAHPSKLRISAPTFQQAFDFCEDKWGVHVFVGANVGLSGYNACVIKSDKNTIFRVDGFIKKREANIACCNAIKEYVNAQ